MERKVLIVDDEKNIVDIVAFNLHNNGYDVICAYDGEKGLDLALSEDPDIVLLDIMMPKMDGFSVCKKIREKSQVPIIMLTARVEEVDKVLGLELGADDYVTKPFGMRELMARVKANLRRRPGDGDSAEDGKNGAKAAAGAAAAVGDVLVFDGLVVDLKRQEAQKDGAPVDLTHREFELLRFLAERPGEVFARDALLEKVWGYDDYYGEVRNVDVTVRRIRAKIEDNSEKPKYIMTRRGAGYYFGGESAS